jgi:hypothetical protein
MSAWDDRLKRLRTQVKSARDAIAGLPKDLALVNGCLETEAELRERSYAAVERLAARVAGRKGELDDRIRTLPSPEARRAIGDLYELGWID